MSKRIKRVLNIYTVLGFSLLLLTLVLVAVPISPYVWYRINPAETDREIEKITVDVVEEDIKQGDGKKNIPTLNEDLPEGYHVIISSISVNSPVSDSRDYTKALRSGSWIVPEYGTPEKDELPIIIASHRFGYASWSNEFRNRISFFNLPKTDIGDTVSIYWNQREYVYKIYGKEESTYISDYNADLILYTCKYFNSPIRIFRYAERIN